MKNKFNNLSIGFYCRNPYGIAYAFCRSLIALSVLLTLLFNDLNVFFRPIEGYNFVNTDWNLFCIFKQNLDYSKWISIAILTLVIIGWQPRITGIFHWWICYSLSTSTLMIDGGEHVASVITLFLIPLTLLDNRSSHWRKLSFEEFDQKSLISKTIALTFFDITKIQVAIIYLHAAVGKCNVPEWINGSVIYYWLSDPLFGLNDSFKPIIFPLINNQYLVAIISWSVLALEFILFSAYFMNRHNKIILLFFGIIFHFFIFIFHGLANFSLIMIAVLIYYLYEPNTQISKNIT